MTKIVNGFNDFIVKMKISKKIIVTVLIIAFILSLLPIIITSFYSVPVLDDYNFGYYTHKSVVEGSSFLGAIVETNRDFYNNWQGFFSANILASAQLFNSNVNLYFVSNLSILFILILAMFAFGRSCFITVMKFSVLDYLIIMIPITEIVIQFLPSIAEGIYWMDGSLSMLTNSITLLVLSTLMEIRYTVSKKTKIIYSIISIMLLLIIFGTSLMNFVTMMIIFVFFYIYERIQKQNVRKLIALLAIIYCVGIVIALIAPGNNVRLDDGFKTELSPKTLVISIVKALFYSVTNASGWFSLAFIAVLLFITPIFYTYAKNSSYLFKNPLLVFIFSYLLYAARMSVQLFTAGYLGADRQMNQYFLGFIVTMTIAWLYFVGWFSKHEFAENISFDSKKISVVFLAIVIFVFGLGCFDFGVKNVASVSTSLSLIKGETQQYSKEMHERIELYEDDSITDVVVEPLSVYPPFFMEESLTDDSSYWTNRSVAKYYNKNSVVLNVIEKGED